MFTFLVLVGSLASALALPTTTDPKASEVLPVPAVAVTESSKIYIKECYEQCVATYGSSGADYTYCLIGCSLGGQKLDIATDQSAPVKEARISQEEKCEIFCDFAIAVSFEAYVYCFHKCLEHHGSSLENVPVPAPYKVDVAVKSVDDVRQSRGFGGYNDCFSTCLESYGGVENSETFKACGIRCAFRRKLEDTPAKMDVGVESVVDMRQSRDYLGCVTQCSAQFGGPTNPAALGCIFKCAFGRNFEDTPAKTDVGVESVDAVLQARGSNDCFPTCIASFASYGGLVNPVAYPTCAIKCSFGRKLEDTPPRDKVGAGAVSAQIAVSAMEARGVDYCSNNCAEFKNSKPAFLGCVSMCLAASMRRRSIEYPREDLTPVTDFDYKKWAVATFSPEVTDKKSPKYVKDCSERCRALYPSSDFDFTYCFNECSIGGQKRDINVDVTLEPVDGVRQARGYSDCVSDCVASYGSLVSAGTAGCFIRCAFDRKLEDSQFTDVDYKKLAAVPFVPTFAPEVFEKKSFEFYLKECYERCETAYKKTDPDYSYCLIGCTVGGQKPKDKVVGVEPFVPIKE